LRLPAAALSPDSRFFYVGEMMSDRALSDLQEGNQRFCENRALHLRRDLARLKDGRESAAIGNYPHMCGSARNTEIIFDQALGTCSLSALPETWPNGYEIASVHYGDLPVDLYQLCRQIKAAVAKTRRANPRMSGRELLRRSVSWTPVDIVMPSLLSICASAS
jgi:hypothetical protein